MIIAIITDPAVGGTFLTWSLHYLAGHNDYYSASEDNMIVLPANPLNGVNAHKFKANKPNTLLRVKSTLEKIQSINIENFHTIYLHNFAHGQDHDLQAAVKHTQQLADKVVILSHNTYDSMYFCTYYNRYKRESFTNANNILDNPKEQLNDFVDFFFKESKNKFTLSGGSPVWELREFLALNVDFRIRPRIEDFSDLSLPHYFLNWEELFNRFEFTVRDLLNYLNVKVDESRWDSWITIYHQWKNIHVQRLQFSLYFDKIVESIKNNYFLDLTRFNLDIVQESAIQRELLYKHNLAMKLYQIEKFTDAHHLHSLLEKNVYHKL